MSLLNSHSVLRQKATTVSKVVVQVVVEEVGYQVELGTIGVEEAPSKGAWEAPPVTVELAALAAVEAAFTEEVEAEATPEEVVGPIL